MSASKTPLSRQIDGYSHLQQNYGNIKVENSSNNDFQFRLNYLEKHFNLVFSSPIINILARTTNQHSRRRPRKSQVPRRNSQLLYNPQGGDFSSSERIKLLEELILRQKVPSSSPTKFQADFNARIGNLEDQLKQARYSKSEKVDDTISNSRLVSLEIKFEQIERTMRLLTDKIAVQAPETDNAQVLHEIRLLKDAVEDCIHNQRQLEIANLDMKRQVRENREVSFEPVVQQVKQVTPKKTIDNQRGSVSGSNKKEGSNEKKDLSYSNLKNKYGNVNASKLKEVLKDTEVSPIGNKKQFYDEIDR